MAAAWRDATLAGAAAAPAPSAQFEINEIATDDTRTVTVAAALGAGMPLVEVPGFALQGTKQVGDAAHPAQKYCFTRKPPEQAAADPVYGESGIPDRKLTLQNLDVIEQQNAWGSIWLTRNKELLPGRATNPAFVYQTPQVSFANLITPLLQNSRTWQIDALGAPDGQPQPRRLGEHLERLFAALLPASASQPYDLRLACRYSFALATGTSGDADLLAALPVLLGPRLTIAAGAPSLDATAEFRASLVRAIAAWQQANRPVPTRGMFVFSATLFSNLGAASGATGDNLPLLRVDDLRLHLSSISSFD